MDTSAMYSRLGRTIQILLEVKWEIRPSFQVGTVIFGFLSIVKKSQASSPFEALNSACLSKCQGMWGPCPDVVGTYGFFYGLQRGFILCFILCDEWQACIQATAGKSELLLSQGISQSTLYEEANSGSFSHTYCWGKGALKELVESWPTASIESWEFALFSR